MNPEGYKMYSFIRRFISGAKTTNKVVCASLKNLRRIKVFGSKRSVEAGEVNSAVTVVSSDTSQGAETSVTTDLLEDKAMVSSVSTSTDISHTIVPEENLQSKRKTNRIRRKRVKSRLNREVHQLAGENGSAMKNAADITLSSCFIYKEKLCKSRAMAVGEESDDDGGVESWKTIGEGRKQRGGHSDKLTYVKEQQYVNKPDRMKSCHTGKSSSNRFEPIRNTTVVEEESIKFNNKSKKIQAVVLETSKTISNKGGTITQKCHVSRAVRKAKRVRFLVNGDRLYKGVIIAVSYIRYRSFDSLLTELSNTLSENKYLPSGVRTILSTDGHKISQLEDFEDGKFYICSSSNKFIKNIEYAALNNFKPSGPSTKLQSTNNVLSRPIKQLGLKIKPKMIYIVRSGPRHRKIVRMLLNKRNSPTFEHVLTLIAESINLDTGAVRKLYTSAGCQIMRLEQFFESDDVFFAYGSERMSQNDLKLNLEEMKVIQSLKRGLRNPENITSSIPNKILNRYTISDRLGNGTFAVVYRCFEKRSNSEYALKVIKKIETPIGSQMIKNELSILKALRHPNIVHLILELVTPTNVYIITELVRGGDLFHAINRGADLSESDNRMIITNLASALAYLHGMDIVHRDVKQENLLVEFDGDGHVLHVKLADFGLSEKVNETLYAVCGTPAYMAPEMLNHEGYGVEIDVWAAGVILYKLLCGFLPFDSEDDNGEELHEDILRGTYDFPEPYWDNVSEEAKDLVCSMLQYNPSLRFSAENVLFHPWCNDYEF